MPCEVEKVEGPGLVAQPLIRYPDGANQVRSEIEMIPDEPPITDPPIYRTLVSDGEETRLIDTIEHEGKLWLVFRWLSSPSKEWRQPERLVRHAILSCRDLRHLPDRPYGADFSLESIMPKVLFGEIPLLPSEQYVVIEHPLLRLRIPTDH